MTAILHRNRWAENRNTKPTDFKLTPGSFKDYEVTEDAYLEKHKRKHDKWFRQDHLTDDFRYENVEQYEIFVGNKLWLCFDKFDSSHDICNIIDFGLKYLKISKRVTYGKNIEMIETIHTVRCNV